MSSYILTICDENGYNVELSFDNKQYALIDNRSKRSFIPRSNMAYLLNEIDKAMSLAELATISKRYDLCDVCDFNQLNLAASKLTLKIIVKMLYKYPRLRSKLCYIGSHANYEQIIKKLINGDLSVLKLFGLQYIVDTNNAKKLADITYQLIDTLLKNHEAYIATYILSFGFFDAVLLDQHDYTEFKINELKNTIKRNESMGFHPLGCGTVDYVVYHELGHCLDYLCNFNQSKEFQTYYKTLNKKQIETGLSIYAAESSSEFIAEAFAEYVCNPTPRNIAITIGKMLDKCYKNL